VIRAEVVDPQGRRLSGADIIVTVWYSRGSAENESVLERTRSDGDGQVQLERERPGARIHHATVWAYQPGRGIATTNVLLTGKAPPPVIRLTLDQPAKWTITALDPDDRPIAGLRLTPRLLRRAARLSLTLPDGWLEPLTVTTDAKGVATLSYLPEIMTLLSIQVAGPGVAPHTLPLDAPRGKDIVLKLGRSGKVVGIVRTASGAPLADVPVELWVQGSGTRLAGHRLHPPIHRPASRREPRIHQPPRHAREEVHRTWLVSGPAKNEPTALFAQKRLFLISNDGVSSHPGMTN
jgi:hypothetical protein